MTAKQWAAMEAATPHSAQRIEQAALRADPGAAQWIKERQAKMQQTREALAQAKKAASDGTSKPNTPARTHAGSHLGRGQRT